VFKDGLRPAFISLLSVCDVVDVFFSNSYLSLKYLSQAITVLRKLSGFLCIVYSCISLSLLGLLFFAAYCDLLFLAPAARGDYSTFKMAAAFLTFSLSQQEAAVCLVGCEWVAWHGMYDKVQF
jgi:hypothetical protein